MLRGRPELPFFRVYRNGYAIIKKNSCGYARTVLLRAIRFYPQVFCLLLHERARLAFHFSKLNSV
jgi:hypothetical protein